MLLRFSHLGFKKSRQEKMYFALVLEATRKSVCGGTRKSLLKTTLDDVSDVSNFMFPQFSHDNQRSRPKTCTTGTAVARCKASGVHVSSKK